MSIKWDDSYNIGIKVIDEQHKGFVVLINKLSISLVDGSGKEKMKDIFSEIEEYAEMHFSLEEKYFEEFEYENKEEHEREHASFRDDIQRMKRHLENNDLELFKIQLLDLLENWLTEHVTGEDKKFVDCFREHGLE